MLGRLSSLAVSSSSTTAATATATSSSSRNLFKILKTASPSSITGFDNGAVATFFSQAGAAAAARPTTTTSSSITTITKRWHGGPKVDKNTPTISVTFLQPDGETKKTVEARVGESFLQTAHRYEIELEGACEGVCACSTCHLIFPDDVYDELPEPSEEEEDMLDMAFGLTETSRLGCQVILTKEMDGIVVEMPKATRNFYVDGHVPKPH